jgi:hypothetical protein
MKLTFRDAKLEDVPAIAGADGFYAKCGFSDRGRAIYQGTPLAYYEALL